MMKPYWYFMKIKGSKKKKKQIYMRLKVEFMT